MPRFLRRHPLRPARTLLSAGTLFSDSLDRQLDGAAWSAETGFSQAPAGAAAVCVVVRRLEIAFNEFPRFRAAGLPLREDPCRSGGPPGLGVFRAASKRQAEQVVILRMPPAPGQEAGVFQQRPHWE